MRYEWLESGWNIEKEKERLCAETLDNRLNTLLTTDSILPYKAELPTFYNEHGYVSTVELQWLEHLNDHEN